MGASCETICAQRQYNQQMKGALSVAIWILFAALLYLIASEAVSPWLALPGFGNVGFTLVFVLFSVLHCARIGGWPGLLPWQ